MFRKLNNKIFHVPRLIFFFFSDSNMKPDFFTLIKHWIITLALKLSAFPNFIHLITSLEYSHSTSLSDHSEIKKSEIIKLKKHCTSKKLNYVDEV